MLEKSKTKILSSGITDNTKPKTAGLIRQRLPEVPLSALSRAKSDLGVYESGESHDATEQNNKSPPSPVEQVIAEDETSMMRIRITTCPKI